MTEEEEMSSEHLKFKWSPGTAGGMSIFVEFLDKRLKTFDRDRAKTDRNSTSQLSPHIHYGEVSVRRIFYMVKQVRSRIPQSFQHGACCS
jgi:deoxyribodipyrimidine photolyase